MIYREIHITMKYVVVSSTDNTDKKYYYAIDEQGKKTRISQSKYLQRRIIHKKNAAKAVWGR